MIEQHEINARVSEDKQAALAVALKADPATISRWLDNTKGGIPRPRIVAFLDALHLAIYDPATHVVMTQERATALETLAAEALMKGRK